MSGVVEWFEGLPTAGKWGIGLGAVGLILLVWQPWKGGSATSALNSLGSLGSSGSSGTNYGSGVSTGGGSTGYTQPGGPLLPVSGTYPTTPTGTPSGPTVTATGGETTAPTSTGTSNPGTSTAPKTTKVLPTVLQPKPTTTHAASPQPTTTFSSSNLWNSIVSQAKSNQPSVTKIPAHSTGQSNTTVAAQLEQLPNTTVAANPSGGITVATGANNYQTAVNANGGLYQDHTFIGGSYQPSSSPVESNQFVANTEQSAATVSALQSNVGAGNATLPTVLHKVAVPVNFAPGQNNTPTYNIENSKGQVVTRTNPQPSNSTAGNFFKGHIRRVG